MSSRTRFESPTTEYAPHTAVVASRTSLGLDTFVVNDVASPTRA